MPCHWPRPLTVLLVINVAGVSLSLNSSESQRCCIAIVENWAPHAACAEVLSFTFSFTFSSAEQGCRCKVRKIFTFCQDGCWGIIYFISTHMRQKLMESWSAISYLASNKVLNQISVPEIMFTLYHHGLFMTSLSGGNKE